ncbi:MAG: hypothetical protein IKQ57_04090 [Candidatus Methanomethylophilaceae archaeon]|nr:hypothetical protein [Candidatus Methanomethylophilaceae archaeon]
MLQNVSLPLRYAPGGTMTPESGIELGRAIASGHRCVAVVSDRMKSSRMMKETLISGILSQGTDVMDAGCAPEPAAAYVARMCDCSVFVTESSVYGHLSGYRMFNKDGSPFTGEQVRHLSTISSGLKSPDHNDLGKRILYTRAVKDYNDYMASVLGEITGAPVVIDCGCGAVAESAPQILTKAGIEVISINAHCDEDFVPKEPSADTQEFEWLHDFISNKEGCIGIGLDRIGSRATVIDEDGDVVDPIKAMSMVVKALRPKRMIASMDTSSLVEMAFAENNVDGSEYLLSSRHIADVASAMVKENADLAVCGDRILYKGLPAPDGIHTAAVISRIANSESLKRMAESMTALYRSSACIRLECEDNIFVHALNERMKESGGFRYACSDGWRVDMDEGWFLVGPPVESAVEIFAESTDKAYLIGLMETATDLVKSCSRTQ